MNEVHLKLCSSDEWREQLQSQLLPWALEGVQLGDELIEIGPGPGLTTDILRLRVPRMTAVELDPMLAAALTDRLAGTNVTVVNADATALPFDAGRFAAAASFTMLHHVPTLELQDRLLAEVARVVRPGGTFIGLDSLDSERFRDLHIDDICVPIDPATMGDRLRAAGFMDVEVAVVDNRARFSGRVPA